jgi:hypothetical protein
MATLTHPTRPNLARIAFVKKRDKIIDEIKPRRCTLISAALMIAGLSIPMLMAVNLLPVTFWLAFAGFALAATGGVMALTLCGEI